MYPISTIPFLSMILPFHSTTNELTIVVIARTFKSSLLAYIVVRCILLFQAIRQEAYETVEGVCVAIRRAPLGGHQRIRLMDESGTAHDLLVLILCIME